MNQDGTGHCGTLGVCLLHLHFTASALGVWSLSNQDRRKPTSVHASTYLTRRYSCVLV